MLAPFGATRWFRPGSGYYNDWMLGILDRHGYRCVLGSVYPVDAQIPWSGLAVSWIRWQTRPGAVIILHDRGERGTRTAETLSEVLPALAEQGYRVATLGELAALAAPVGLEPTREQGRAVGSIDLEVGLSEEERTVRETVHDFARDVMRPAGAALDALADPADVIGEGSILWEVFEKHRTLGLEALADPSSGLTPVQQARLRSIVAEELGWGDAGLAISFGVSGFPRALAQMSGKPELNERFARPDVIGCWAITEPDHGSDQIRFATDPRPGSLLKPNCVARRDGDSFVISGQKAAWVSNGTIADAAALFCAVDTGDGISGVGGFVIPLDEPGVSRGKPLDKIGQRALNQGEIFFDGLRVPADYLVVPPELYALGGKLGLSQANSGMGATFVGVAQAALDLALDYAKQRVQGGMAIIEHQSVKARLFEMFRKVEAARSLSRRVMACNAVRPPQLEYAIASKVTSTQAAFDVASAAVQIFGGNGLCREYPVEKLLRDARASMIEDGCNEVLGLAAAAEL